MMAIASCHDSRSDPEDEVRSSASPMELVLVSERGLPLAPVMIRELRELLEEPEFQDGFRLTLTDRTDGLPLEFQGTHGDFRLGVLARLPDGRICGRQPGYLTRWDLYLWLGRLKTLRPLFCSEDSSQGLSHIEGLFRCGALDEARKQLQSMKLVTRDARLLSAAMHLWVGDLETARQHLPAQRESTEAGILLGVLSFQERQVSQARDVLESVLTARDWELQQSPDASSVKNRNPEASPADLLKDCWDGWALSIWINCLHELGENDRARSWALALLNHRHRGCWPSQMRDFVLHVDGGGHTH